jgi:glutamate synthase domain-containing protein 1
MANFHIENQTVHGHQYNAETINFTEASTLPEYVSRLKSLESELEKTIQAGLIKTDSAPLAQQYLEQAITAATAETPDNKSIVDYLHKFKELVSGVDGLVGAAASAITTIGALLA